MRAVRAAGLAGDEGALEGGQQADSLGEFHGGGGRIEGDVEIFCVPDAFWLVVVRVGEIGEGGVVTPVKYSLCS